MRNTTALLALLSTVTLGCSGIARGPDQYRDDTRALLETQNAQIKSCYDNALEQNPAQSGTVTVNFTVEKKTGVIKEVTVDPEQTTAPDSLQQCIVAALDGLKLTPEDRKAGEATFSWVFRGPSANADKAAF